MSCGLVICYRQFLLSNYALTFCKQGLVPCNLRFMKIKGVSELNNSRWLLLHLLLAKRTKYSEPYLHTPYSIPLEHSLDFCMDNLLGILNAHILFQSWRAAT